MMTADDKAAKLALINAFFEDLRERVAFTEVLWNDGRRSEALLLVTCYIDGLGQWLYPSNSGSSSTFVRVLREHGGEPHLLAVLPNRLSEQLLNRGKSEELRSAIQERVRGLEPQAALTETELFQALVGLDAGALGFLRRHVWRGTVANVAYGCLRSPNVHELGSPNAITFSNMTFAGEPLKEVSFQSLFRALLRIVEHAGTLSGSSGKWFGHG